MRERVGSGLAWALVRRAGCLTHSDNPSVLSS